MATSGLSTPDDHDRRRVTQLADDLSIRSLEDLATSTKRRDDKESGNDEKLAERAAQFFFILVDIVLVLCAVAFIFLSAAALWLTGKPVALNPFGKRLIQATKLVRQAL